MTISEAQLDVWAKQGSVTQSQGTYATVRGALEAADASYGGNSYTIFLQGSYGNDTNIYADSDVDVVMRLDSVFWDDLTNLTDEDRAIYNSARTNADYSYTDFRAGVNAQLVKKFGNSVKPATKAIFVEGNGARRDADVLPCAQFRKYSRFRSWSDQSFVEGICFWTTGGEQIINYPALHSANCTSKHQATASWFKPTVRIFKNMRNAMVDNGYFLGGDAPSYFIEGMLWNVPTAKFGASYVSTGANALNWLRECDQTKLVCANEQYYLCHPNSPVTWRAEKLKAFLDAAVSFWNES